MRHRGPTSHLRFIATHGDTTHLGVATGNEGTSPVTTTRGVLSLEGEKTKARDLPWLHIAEPPVTASASGQWMALLAQPDALGTQVRLWLWTEGKRPAYLAEGDQLRAVDALCDGRSCVLLTTRPGPVAKPGASAWFGAIDSGPKNFSNLEISAASLGPGAVSLGIAHADPAAKQLVAAFHFDRRVRFYDVRDGATRDAGDVPAEDRVLDTTATAKTPVAILLRGRVDDQGCAPRGSSAVIAPTGSPPDVIPTSGPVESADAQPLGDGAFVSWIAPVNCKDPRRKVVTGVLLDAEGKRVSSPMAIANGHGFAMATSKNNLSMWLADDVGVLWVRARCSPSIDAGQ